MLDDCISMARRCEVYAAANAARRATLPMLLSVVADERLRNAIVARLGSATIE
jgi:hypothetical protein